MATNTVLSKTGITELEVVNKMLRVVDISPVSSLTGSNDLEVTNAIEDFSDVNRAVQGFGWKFNTRINKQYIRDVNNEVIFGPNVLSIEPVSFSKGDDLVLKEGKVFDRENDTFALSSDPYLNVIELINFEDLPHVARQYIQERSVRVHERINSADDTKTETTTEAEIRAWSGLINDHSRSTDETMEDNQEVWSDVFGRE